MPWQERSTMDARVQFVGDYAGGELSIILRPQYIPERILIVETILRRIYQIETGVDVFQRIDIEWENIQRSLNADCHIFSIV